MITPGKVDTSRSESHIISHYDDETGSERLYITASPAVTRVLLLENSFYEASTKRSAARSQTHGATPAQVLYYVVPVLWLKSRRATPQMCSDNF